MLSASGYGLGVTSAITVTPAAPSQVVITTQPPATVTARTGFGLQASIEDQYGNVVTTATNTVSVALATDPTVRNAGRDAVGECVQRRCRVFRPDQHDRGVRLHDPGLQQRACQCDLERLHREPGGRQPVADHNRAARRGQGERRRSVWPCRLRISTAMW